MAEAGFLKLQYEFTQHMRDPANSGAPQGVEDRRLEIYRNLLYNNVEGFMSNAFPVLRKLTDNKRWHAMIRDYFSRHHARTPLFPKMPQEFLHYLETERRVPDDPPFMLELARYEWLEAEVMNDCREIDPSSVDAGLELLTARPVANPVMRPDVYTFPVHRIGPDYQPEQAPAEPTYLVVYRRRNDEVSFMELNAVSARLLQLIIENETHSGHALLRQIAEELAHPDPQLVITNGEQILKTLQERELILGAAAVG